ncbi:ABC transporter ATP-binding protein [Lusitaniella coriacea LEGE 07157]|uniref:ABC transporter ATP-binding protein n=1 Tax=Lusitaniella coriacea LEGE 07157 TaxID=945747 RepID=A0A8J7AVZ0_9CYAN|nr:ABC transporter ATP-binding protein [Lusitaniella coriacea LEGE 07157]
MICVEHLGKKYRIGRQQEPYRSLRDVLTQKVRRLFRPSQVNLQPFEEFWALDDVSFTIKRGDRVGIIGRNGAGKSTLLKILSRITEPTAGRVALRGRVASLLEVGTGFHPELTGRENIYLNGAILGMSKAEIRRKFDEIVAFAEVARFLDTPVKRYSSGMYVRLAFAVAAHLEPDILVVDEVLAVGDAGFQKKCLGKMKDVGQQGRTVIFVSHQMGTISQLCNRAFLFDRGQILTEGTPQETIAAYMKNLVSGESNQFMRRLSKESDMQIDRAETIDASGIPTSTFGHTETIILKIQFSVNCWYEGVILGVSLKDGNGRKVFTTEANLDKIKGKSQTVEARVKIPANFITPGSYYFLIALHIPNVRLIETIDEVCQFIITDMGSQFSLYEGLDYGCVFANCEWQFSSATGAAS